MVVESSPVSPFIMIESDFVFELLKVTFDAPADFDQADDFLWRRGSGHGGEPVLGWFEFAHRPFDDQPLFIAGRAAPVVSMRRPHALQSKARGHLSAGSLAPADGPKGSGSQPPGQIEHRMRVVLAAATQKLGSPAHSLPTPRGKRLLSWRPHFGFLRDPNCVGKTAGDDPLAELRDHPVSGIGHHRGAWQFQPEQPVDFFERDLPFGLEAYLWRDLCCGAGSVWHNPLLRQVEPVGARNAHRAVHQRDGYRHLAIRSFSQHPAVLPRHPNRVAALLRYASVIEHPGRHWPMALHLLERILSGHFQHSAFVPRSLGHEVMHRLMPHTDIAWINLCRHRL